MSSPQKQDRKPPRFPNVVEAKFVLGMQTLSSAPASDLPEVAFAGRSNVGKSSLLNTLMQRRNLVRTSSTPGCTRQINVFEARHADAWTIRLVDLPGFGYAKRSKQERSSWGQIIEDYLRERSNLSMVVLLVDARRGVEEEELMLGEFLRHVRGEQLPLQLVATKIDRLPRSSVKPTLGRIVTAMPGRVIDFSAKTGQGGEALWRAIRVAVGPSTPGSPTSPPSDRQPESST